MPKVDRDLLDDATSQAVGSFYYRGRDMAKWKEVRRLAGITKGQWKRFQNMLKYDSSYKAGELRVSELAARKLRVMAKHGKSPHLLTLLRMVEHTMEVDDEQ